MSADQVIDMTSHSRDVSPEPNADFPTDISHFCDVSPDPNVDFAKMEIQNSIKKGDFDAKEFFERKLVFYNNKKYAHLTLARNKKMTYYIMSNIAAVASVVVSFLTGVSTLSNVDAITLCALVFSLVNSITHTVMNVSDINSKLVRHADSFNKYEGLACDIEKILIKMPPREEMQTDAITIIDRENIIRDYEIIDDCSCFNSKSRHSN